VVDDIKDILHKGFDEFRQWVNPLIAQRAAMAGEPVQLLSAHGGPPLDDQGRPVEDMHGTQVLGHRNPAITAALQEFLKSDSLNWYPSRVNPFAGRLARRLCERTGYSNAYFGMSGSDGVEAAVKLARAATRKPRVLAMTGAYHGCGLGSTALMTPGPFKDMFGPHLPGAETLPLNDVDALHRAMRSADVACVVVEPIQVEGGVRTLSAEYVEALGTLTQQHGALLIADEVQTGLGRSGHFLMSATWPRKADVVVLAKMLGGGIVPVSAMLTHRAIFEQAYGANFQAGEAHNCTFGFNGFTATAALATLDLITDDVIAGVVRKGAHFQRVLKDAQARCELLEDIRGQGLMLGIQLKKLNHPWLTFEHVGLPDIVGRDTVAPVVCHRLYKRGFFAFSCGHDWSVLRLQPRFEIPDETLTVFADVLAEEGNRLLRLQ